MKNKGISLISLVITIIILVILTSVVVIQIINQENILNKANKAVNNNNETVALDKVLIELCELKVKAAEENKNVYEYILNDEHWNEMQNEIREKELEILKLEDETILFISNGYQIYADKNGNIIDRANGELEKYQIIFNVNGGNKLAIMKKK